MRPINNHKRDYSMHRRKGKCIEEWIIWSKHCNGKAHASREAYRHERMGG